MKLDELFEISKVAPEGATHVQWGQTADRFHPMEDVYHKITPEGLDPPPSFRLTKSPTAYLRFYKQDGDDWEVVGGARFKIAIATGQGSPPAEDRGNGAAGDRGDKGNQTEGERRELREVDIQVRRMGYEADALKERDRQIEASRDRERALEKEMRDDLRERLKKAETDLANAPKGIGILDVMIHPDGERVVQNVILMIDKGLKLVAQREGAREGASGKLLTDGSDSELEKVLGKLDKERRAKLMKLLLSGEETIEGDKEKA